MGGPSGNSWQSVGQEQNRESLTAQIKEAGSGICGVQKVKVANHVIQRRARGSLAVCPKCKEGYPLDDGPVYLACSGKEILYLSFNKNLPFHRESIQPAKNRKLGEKV